LGQSLSCPPEQIRGTLGPGATNIEQPWQTHIVRIGILALLEHQGPYQRGLPAPPLTDHKTVEPLAQRGTNPSDLIDAIDEELMVRTRVQQRSSTQFHVFTLLSVSSVSKRS